MKLLIVIASFLIFSHTAFSAKHRMVQAGKAFIGDKTDADLSGLKKNGKKFKKSKIKKLIVKKMSIKKGDSIIFVNKDSVEHNVASNKMKVNLKQKSGSTDTVTFNKKGSFLYRCNIHPRMKIKVTVQ